MTTEPEVKYSDRPFGCFAKKPLMLWCSSHVTLSKEEIPLFLQAGFRVVPLLTDLWTYRHAPSLDGELCQDWKQTVDLPAGIIDRLQAIQMFSEDPAFNISRQDLELLNRYVDVIYLTVLPNVAIKLTACFNGTVIFRPFGHGSLSTYTRIARVLGVKNLKVLRSRDNYIWCPILSTLQEPEDPEICKNALQVGAFVSAERLGNHRWVGRSSEPVIIETIPRIMKQHYYREIYADYVKNYGDLPVKILGGNEQQGGDLRDPRIVGRLDDDGYHRRIASARISIYHGTSPYHLHYHPLEYMSLGIPVLFNANSAIAAESRNLDVSETRLRELGMYRDVEEARRMASEALNNVDWAVEMSERQRFFSEEVFSRRRALHQAQWLRTTCIDQLRSLRLNNSARIPRGRVAKVVRTVRRLRVVQRACGVIAAVSQKFRRSNSGVCHVCRQASSESSAASAASAQRAA